MDKQIHANLKKQDAILAQLEEQQKEQRQILNEQKKLLAELKEHKSDHQKVRVRSCELFRQTVNIQSVFCLSVLNGLN